LIGYTLPAIAGFTNVQSNLPALIQNSGIEATFGGTVIKTNAFSWSANFNFSAPKNKLLAYPNLQSSPYVYTFSVGKSLFSRLLYHYTGVDPLTGYYTFQTKNGSSNPTYGKDMYWSEPITTKYHMGVENSFSYRGFSVSFLIQLVKKLGYNYMNSFNEPGTNAFNQLKFIDNRWKQPGDKTGVAKFSTDYNGYAYGQYYSYLQSSDAIISDASFVRLKNLSISYQFPDQLRQRFKARVARVYLQCQNLITITRYIGWDPETGGLNLPPMRVVTGGFQVSF
jgi:hypothetical protein